MWNVPCFSKTINMNLKPIVCFLIPLTLISCKLLRLYEEEEIVLKTATTNVQLENNTPLVKVKINGTETNFLFDTGATGSCITDTTIVQNFHKQQFANIGIALGADGKRVKNKKFSVALQSELFDASHKVMGVINLPLLSCQSKRTFSGILGMDIFFENNLNMYLDFSKNQLSNIGEDQIKYLLQQGNYHQVESKFKYKKIFIFLTIEDKKYRFHLDTGYNGSITIPYHNNHQFKNANRREILGASHMTISSVTTGKKISYEKMPVRFGGENISTIVNLSSSISAQNVGTAFMKGFDWIIDYHNQKVYVKRNSNLIAENFERKISFGAQNNSGRLIVSAKDVLQTKYNIGDEIVAIKGQKITVENICEMQTLLNSTEDWNDLELEVKPIQK